MNVTLNEFKEIAYALRDSLHQCDSYHACLHPWGYKTNTVNSKDNCSFHIVSLIELEDIIHKGKKMYRYVQCKYEERTKAKLYVSTGAWRITPNSNVLIKINEVWVKFIESLYHRLKWFHQKKTQYNKFIEVANFVEKEYNELKDMSLIF
jgi:hypothetical protein